MVLVSACLTGKPCRYDGRHSRCDALLEKLAGLPYLALCPEQLGGLPTPRAGADIIGAAHGDEGPAVLRGRARVVTRDGRDVSPEFISGAREVLRRCREAGVSRAFLKDRSPSCGYDPGAGNPKGGPGRGILAALLEENGIAITQVIAPAQD